MEIELDAIEQHYAQSELAEATASTLPVWVLLQELRRHGLQVDVSGKEITEESFVDKPLGIK